MWDEFWTDRGAPLDHDPGPTRTGEWARLFANTPDYRALGVEALDEEAFRWHFGPMFYRGRLERGQARVLVVGQEGAQDESLATAPSSVAPAPGCSTCCAGSASRSSYLFLNTFVYPIFGQYDDELRPLAQDLTRRSSSTATRS